MDCKRRVNGKIAEMKRERTECQTRWRRALSGTPEITISCRRLLLRHAMHGAQAPNQVAGIDRNDRTGSKEFSKRVQRDAVVGIVEHGNKHDAVSYIKIRVAGRESAAFEDHRAWHGNLNDVQTLP